MESSRIIVQVISKEMIKPSSQTPSHLKKHNLSLLDQLQSPFYFPLIMFYESPSPEQQQQHPQLVASMKETSEKLKKSLSETLTTFYPLAGRLHQENLAVVDCVDAGSNYVEARAHHARLSDVVYQEEHHENLTQYLPVIPLGGLTDDGVLLHVQVTFFDCGGFVLGVCLSHRVGDAGSLVSFLNSWAATCLRGKAPHHQQIKPCFDLAAHFPVQGLSSSAIGSKYLELCNSPIDPELPNTLVTKRVVFDKEKLAQLRRAAENDDAFVVKRPSRVELASAFIWKCFRLMGVSTGRSVNCAMIAVNIRTRVIPPPTLEHAFGNGMVVIPYVFTEQDVPEYQDMARKIRNTIGRVSDEYIRTIQSGNMEDEGYLGEFHNHINVLMRGGVQEFCCISSWCRFPMYDLDYGWGGPVWVATTGMYQNFAILMDSKSGDGIEAWITIPRSNAGTLVEILSNTQQ